MPDRVRHDSGEGVALSCLSANNKTVLTGLTRNPRRINARRQKTVRARATFRFDAFCRPDS